MGRPWKKRRPANGAKSGAFLRRDKQGKKQKKHHGHNLSWQINRKMEAFYALQGLHNQFWDEETQSFRDCENDEQKEAERQRWMTTLKGILPTSFRIGTDVDPILRQSLEQELDAFVGKELEIKVAPPGARQRYKQSEKGNDEKEAKASEDMMDVTQDVAQDGSKPEAKKASEVAQKPEANAGEQDAEGIDQLQGNLIEKKEDQDANKEDEHDGFIIKRLAPARKVSFIPHAYQLSLDRRTLRRNPDLAKFHEWLKVQTNAGFITRQETVSMIPPIVLSVEPHHQVLDMCAAPGSKTSQILEMVSQHVKPTDLEPTGCVVANDSDPKRAFMLVHQLKRINSPAAFVTNCDAQFFPLLKDRDAKAVGDEGMFDRGKERFL